VATLALTTPPGVLLHLGGQWTLSVETRDADGNLSSAVTPTLAITLPDGTTVAPVFADGDYAGAWLATYTPLVVGRFLAHASTPQDAVDAATYVASPTTSAGMPTVDDVARYLKSAASSWTQAELQDELDSEFEHQQAKCGVRAVYPRSLRKALLRRVQRALAMRALPLATLQGDADGGAMILPGNDPEVRRLEGPYRKLVSG
jgi:hypothetical protein